MLLSPDRGRGWERGLHELSKPPLLTSPPSGGEELEKKEEEEETMSARPTVVPKPEEPEQPWQWSEARWRGIVERVRAGKMLRPATWPDGARCAVALSFELRPRDRRAARGRRIDRSPEPGPVRQPRRHPAHPGADAEIRHPGDLLRAGRLGHAPSRRAAPRGGRGPRDRHPWLDPRAQLDPARGVGARPADARGRHAGEGHRPPPGRHPHAVLGFLAADARHHARHGAALRLLADGRRRLLRAAARRRSRPASSSCRSSGSATTRSTST